MTSHSCACGYMSERHHDVGRIGSVALFSSQTRAGSHSVHVTDVREPGDDVKNILLSAMSSSVSETYALSVSSSHTMSVSVLQSGQEVQRGAGLSAAAFVLERSTSGFSTQCCSFLLDVWK